MTRTSCPCGTGRTYDECCGPFHRGTSSAASAEELMRSRYAAFAVGDASYLLRTWHPATRPPALDLDDEVRWTGLEVLATTDGREGDRRGVVEFRAHHLSRGVPGTLQEVSRFRHQGGEWLYVRGRTS